jgi:hypothetical protein
MPQGDVETYHEDSQWKNRHEGVERAFSTHATKEEAVATGRDAARNAGVEHIIRNLDGQIGERNTYGNDLGNNPRLTRRRRHRPTSRNARPSAAAVLGSRRSGLGYLGLLSTRANSVRSWMTLRLCLRREGLLEQLLMIAIASTPVVSSSSGRMAIATAITAAPGWSGGLVMWDSLLVLREGSPFAGRLVQGSRRLASLRAVPPRLGAAGQGSLAPTVVSTAPSRILVTAWSPCSKQDPRTAKIVGQRATRR